MTQEPTTGGANIRAETPLQERYINFWRPILQELKSRGEITKEVRDDKDSFFDGPPMGVGGVIRRMRLTNDGMARVEIWIKSPDEAWNKGMLDLLQQSEEALEEELGAELVWDRNPQNKRCCVGVAIGGSIDDSEEHLEKIRRWMVDHIVRFGVVFPPRLRDAKKKMR